MRVPLIKKLTTRNSIFSLKILILLVQRLVVILQLLLQYLVITTLNGKRLRSLLMNLQGLSKTAALLL